jgi:hypothetical protein
MSSALKPSPFPAFALSRSRFAPSPRARG